MHHKLGVLFDNAADAMLVAEKASGIILEANSAASRLLQLPHEKIAGMHQSQLHPKNDTSSFSKHLEELKEIDLTVPHESQVLSSDGSEIPVEILASQIDYDEKQCIIATFRDISIRKQTEKVLKESKDEFKNVIQSSPNAFYIYNLENDNRLILTAANPAAEKIIGITHKSLIGKTIEEAFPNLISTDIPEIYRKIARGEMNNYSFEIPYQDERFKGVYNVHVYATKANTIVVDFRDITERFMNEEKLRDSQLLLKSSLESQKDTILFSIDSTYRYLYFNKAHVDAMKSAYNQDIELGMNTLDCITLDEDRKAAKENYDHALRGESHTNVRIFGESNPAYYESFFNPIVNDRNEIIGATALARDITERKKTEQELQEIAQRLKLATDAGKLGIWDRDLEANTMKWNERMFELYGITEDTFSNNVDAWINGLHPEDKQRAVNESHLAIEGDKDFDTTFRVLHPNGTVKYLKAYAVIVRDNSGKAIRMTGINRDITEQIQVENALKESEEKSRLLIKNSNDIIVLVNEKGEQTFISDVVENITGYTAEELYGNIIDVIHPEDVELVSQHWNEVLSNPKKPARVQYRHKHKIRGFIWLEAVAQNFLDNPSINSVVVNIRDITHNKESETKLKQLNATKDKLFSIIAHDLRSPVSSIVGFSDLLINKLQISDIEKAKKFASIINTSAKNNLHLVDNLLSWAKTQTGNIDFTPKNIGLNGITEDILKVLKPSATLKKVNLAIAITDDTIAYADPNMLQTILRNLVSNAIKFTNSCGRIEVSAESNQDHVEITVSDDGMGITEENQKKLFGADLNYTTVGTAAESGSGLGLMLCKEFVEKHGGEIWVESEVWKGSRFMFTLPASDVSV